MTYFKSLLFNFLTVFFVNHVLPGVQIAYYTKLPHIRGEIAFAFILGFINSLIFPIMRFFKLPLSHFRIGLWSFVVSFAAYSLVNILPVGIHLSTAGAYIWSGLIVWFASYFTNHLEYRKYIRDMEKKAEKKKHDEDED